MPMAMNHLMSIAKRAQQEASEPHIKEAGDLFAIYERLRDERQALEKDVDPNIYTVALTRANPKFAHQWPVFHGRLQGLHALRAQHVRRWARHQKARGA